MNDELPELRAKINTLDEQLISLLGKRFELTQRVGLYKKSHQLPAVDLAREAELIARIRDLAAAHQLDPALAEKILRLIIDAVVENHRKLAET